MLRSFLALLVVPSILAMEGIGSEVPNGLAPSQRLHDLARELSSQDLSYNSLFHCHRTGSRLAMDCSNTTRWAIREVTGEELPRTASDQYRYLQGRGNLVRLPRRPSDRNRWLNQNLRPGDLLFWEHTYRPRRRPPITHVMIYLGNDPSGQPMMFGAQSSRGVDVYRFDPDQSMGGYRIWLGLIRREGRFVAVGRPEGLASPR